MKHADAISIGVDVTSAIMHLQDPDSAKKLKFDWGFVRRGRRHSKSAYKIHVHRG